MNTSDPRIDGPAPLPLSATRQAGDLLFLSGQVGTDPATGEIAKGDVVAQTRQVLANLDQVLAARGLSSRDVVKTTIFLADPADFAAVNQIYAAHFSAPYPARSTVAAVLVMPDLLVEIEAIAISRNEDATR